MWAACSPWPWGPDWIKREESGTPELSSDTMWPAGRAMFLLPCPHTVILTVSQNKSSLSCFVTVTRIRRSTAFKCTNTASELEDVRELIPQSLAVALRLDLANTRFCVCIVVVLCSEVTLFLVYNGTSAKDTSGGRCLLPAGEESGFRVLW